MTFFRTLPFLPPRKTGVGERVGDGADIVVRSIAGGRDI